MDDQSCHLPKTVLFVGLVKQSSSIKPPRKKITGLLLIASTSNRDHKWYFKLRCNAAVASIFIETIKIYQNP